MGSMFSSEPSPEWLRERRKKRNLYAAKLRGWGILPGSNKWNSLMYRKRFESWIEGE